MNAGLLAWRRQHANTLFAVYGVLLFALFVFTLGRAWLAGAFVLEGAGGLAIAVGSYFLAIFIILLGFSTPRYAYVSLDRITQAGLILAFSPADAALINALASFTYPLIAQRRQYGTGMALVRSMHNSAMFGLMIYWAGLAYQSTGGTVPVMQLDVRTAVAFGVLILTMQFVNSAFLHVRAIVMAVPRRFEPDWYSHAIEVPVAIVGLLTALIYNGMRLEVFALFMLMLVSVIVIAKFLNEVTIALKRRIIEDLRPSSLSNLGLTAALEILTREYAERAGIEVETSLEAVQLSESTQLTVYRMVQEALTNIGKYANASRVLVSVHSYPTHVDVQVRDDGVGFDPALVPPSSHGLAGMRHRVEAAGGRLSFTTGPGKGTLLSAVLPMQRATAEPPKLANPDV